MKKMLALLLSLMLVLVMTACGANESLESSLDDYTSEISSIKEQGNEDGGWKDFLKEYEEWADKYISVIKKYKANPSDMSILSEYTSLLTELADWTERADDVSDSIKDVEDAAEYSAEVIRIAAKIAKAAEEL